MSKLLNQVIGISLSEGVFLSYRNTVLDLAPAFEKKHSKKFIHTWMIESVKDTIGSGFLRCISL